MLNRDVVNWIMEGHDKADLAEAYVGSMTDEELVEYRTEIEEARKEDEDEEKKIGESYWEG